MILLTATTMSLQVVLGAAPAANQAVIVAAYADHTATAFTPGASNGLSNGTTAVTAVAAPAASTQRQVKYLSILNADTAAMTVTVRVNDNGTLRNLFAWTIQAGERIEFSDGNGFCVEDSTGARKGTLYAPDTGFQAPTLLNSWVNFGAPYSDAGYRLIGSIGYLRGVIKNGTATSGTTLFNVPAGFRPSATVVFPTSNANSPTDDIRVELDTAGDLILRGSASNSYLALDGITYPIG